MKLFTPKGAAIWPDRTRAAVGDAIMDRLRSSSLSRQDPVCSSSSNQLEVPARYLVFQKLLYVTQPASRPASAITHPFGPTIPNGVQLRVAPRDKQFDIEKVLDRATQAFWATGYEATSMTELLNSMVIGRGSFYDTFGSKHELFIRVLVRYDGQRKATFRRAAASATALERIVAPFEHAISEAVGGSSKSGCLLVNASLELPRDAVVQKIIEDANTEAVAYFRNAIEAGQRADEIAASLSPLDASRTLLALLLGVRVLTRSQVAPSMLRSIRRQVMGLLI